MAWGGRRAGAGRKPKSEHRHWLSGTTSRARAANQPSNVAALPVSDGRDGTGDGWRPSRRDRARFNRAGKRYLDDVAQRFDIALTEAPTVLTIALEHDRIARLEQLQKKAKLLREQIQLERLILEYRKRIDHLQQKLINGNLNATEADDPYA